jgi:hypothetical protein
MTGGYFGLVTFENDTNSGDSNHGILHLYNSKTTAIGDDARIMFSFKEGDGTVHPLASMGAVKEGSFQGAIQFNTRSAAGSYSEKMRITAGGNVGIGTTSIPSGYKLGITGSGINFLTGNTTIDGGYKTGSQVVQTSLQVTGGKDVVIDGVTSGRIKITIAWSNSSGTAVAVAVIEGTTRINNSATGYVLTTYSLTDFYFENGYYYSITDNPAIAITSPYNGNSGDKITLTLKGSDGYAGLTATVMVEAIGSYLTPISLSTPGTTTSTSYISDIRTFRTGNTERARIASTGGLLVGGTTSYGIGNTQGYLIVNNIIGIATDNTSSANNRNWSFQTNGYENGSFDFISSSANNTWANDAYRMAVTRGGSTYNTTGTYGTLASDERLKQDITDATSQWDDVKAIRFRKFKMRQEVKEFGDAAEDRLGVIAQEARQVSPKLVTSRLANEKDIAVNPELEGQEVLGFKDTVLFWKAAVALQEAMARIEALEAEVAALKNA